MLLPTEYVKPIKPWFSSKIEQEGGRNLPVDDPYEVGMCSAVAQSNTEVLLTKFLQDSWKHRSDTTSLHGTPLYENIFNHNEKPGVMLIVWECQR